MGDTVKSAKAEENFKSASPALIIQDHGGTASTGTPAKQVRRSIASDHRERTMKAYTISRTELFSLAAGGAVGSASITFALYFYKLWSEMDAADAAYTKYSGPLFFAVIAFGAIAILSYGAFASITFRIKREAGESFWQALLP